MPGSLRSDDSLTPASLAMPRQRIVLADTSLRVASLYGAASPRDWTVCGIKRLLFPPAVLRDYRFGLALGAAVGKAVNGKALARILRAPAR